MEHRGAFREAGAELVAVGNGRAQWLQGFVDEMKPEFPVYTDPGRGTFDGFGMKHSGASLLSPKTMVAGVKAMSKGFKQTGTRGDPFQLGGVAVVTTAGDIVFRHVEAFPGDHAVIDDVLAACRAAV